MKKHLFVGTSVSAITAFVASSASATGDRVVGVSVASVNGAGRNIMRTAEGGIVAAFGKTSAANVKLVFSRSDDNGQIWNDFVVNDVSGAVGEVAVDSNFQGSYVAFTEQCRNVSAGRIAYFSAPFATDPNCLLSGVVTPPDVVPRETSIQASRAGWGSLAAENRETVVYGWQDARTNWLYIGVSPDGRTFPMAKLVVADVHAKSGPAVAIRGNFVIATYLTTDPALAPADVAVEMRAGRSYPAWVESIDGGLTWTKPAPLFGVTSAAFPSAEVEVASGEYRRVRLAGGTNLPNSPILNWSASRIDNRDFIQNVDKTIPEPKQGLAPSVTLKELDQQLGGITFVQSSMMGVDVNGKHGEVSIVSFRPTEQGAEWTHVIASNLLATRTIKLDERSPVGNAQVPAAAAQPASSMDDKPTDSGLSKFESLTSQFQYSALIDTAVRATVYKEVDAETAATRLVAAISTDTGKKFDRHLSFDESELAALGIKTFKNTTVFAASQCLFEDRNGEVYIDIIVADDGAMHYARVPIGVNASEFRTTK